METHKTISGHTTKRMASETRQGRLTRTLERIARRAASVADDVRAYRSRTADGAVRLHGAIGVVTLAAIASFLLGSSFTIFPVLAFVALIGYGWRTYQAETAKAVTFLTTIVTVLVLAFIIAFLLIEAEPVVAEMGLDLFVRVEQPLWGGPYSLTPMMIGTALTTVIATAIAAPLGIAGAIFVSEIAPTRVREVVKPGIELMAGIPSITYGFIGLTILNDYLYQEFSTPTIGNYFAAGLMIGIMALPTVVTVAEDALSTVPESMKSGALAMGSTEWQTTKSVTIPAALSGVSAGVLLGIGRAMGETMAATVMLSHTKGFPTPVFDVFSNYGETLTTVIAFEGGNASGLQLSALFAGGVVLFFMVMVLSVASQWIEWRMQRKLQGKE